MLNFHFPAPDSVVYWADPRLEDFREEFDKAGPEEETVRIDVMLRCKESLRLEEVNKVRFQSFMLGFVSTNQNNMV